MTLSSQTPIITRFAPSPTGFLHIGGARTALFNWLYARGRGGKMLLRIEDTDRARSTTEAIDAILEGMKWLGLNWDGEVIYQFARAHRHAEVAHEMIKAGRAYYCYATPEELEEMREKARSEGRTARYDGRWRDRSPSEAPQGAKPVVRLKAPQEGETVIEDAVQGRVTWANKDLDDLVLLRSDGTPTYMLSVVVDDHDMGITHIIRGDDHFTNAARQKQIYDAMGWQTPNMAHIPLIHGPDGAKLSKRHGALGVEAYRDMGYLPAGLRNYLARLGWSHGDQEFFTTEELIAAFDTDHVGKSPSRMDFAKLAHVNAHAIKTMSEDDLIAAILSLLPHIPDLAPPQAWLDAGGTEKIKAALPSLRERATTLLELLDGARFLWLNIPLPFEDKASAMLHDAARAHLTKAHQALKAVTDWSSPQAAEQAIKALVQQENIKLGDVAQPLRAALTGRTSSPPIFDVVWLLGREETLARLRTVIDTKQ